MKIQLLSFVTLISSFHGLHATGDTNPSLYYWQGAALLPELNEESARWLKDMASTKEPFDPTRFSSKNYQSTAAFLRKAAGSSGVCDWGLDLEDGFSLQLPHLSKIRELHAVAVCLALEEFSRGETESGVDWLLISHRMARHGGAGNTLISWLVYSAMEKNSLNTAALHALNWPKKTREKYAAALLSQRPLSFADSVKGELHSIDAFEALAKDATKLKEVAAGVGLDPSQSTPEAISKGIAEIRKIHERIQEILALQGEGRSRGLAELEKSISGSASSLVKSTIPSIRTFGSDLVLETRMMMFQSLLQHGPEITNIDVSELKHLLTGAPVELSKTETEVTLRCGEVELRGRIQ